MDTNVVSFEEATRARAPRAPVEVSLETLKARQPVVPIAQCHAGLVNVTFDQRFKATTFRIFKDLSAGFPRGRKITILGHPATGKSVMMDLLQRRLPPTKGQVIVNSNFGWQVNSMAFMDMPLPMRDNLRFLANVVGVPPGRFTGAVREFCDLGKRSFNDRMKDFPIWVRKRIAFLVVAACNFDCHLIDGSFSPVQMKLEGADADRVVDAIYGRDYIATVRLAKKVPPNCDLVYILFEGQLYAFDDVGLATEVFQLLPPPSYGSGGRSEGDEDGDTEPDDFVL
ncbi:MAG: hypothetical protein AAF318_13755 [Pseudomonadota bacterium]